MFLFCFVHSALSIQWPVFTGRRRLVAGEGILEPDQEADDDEGRRCQQHEAVVLVAEGIKPAGHHLPAEEFARAQQLAEERHGR